MFEFFTQLYGELSGYVPVYTYPTSERVGTKAWKDMDLCERKWFHWPSQAEALIIYCDKMRKGDVYVPVGLCKNRSSSKKEQIEFLSVIHCDADNARPSLFATEPSMTIESSPGRFQLYWKLKEPVPAAKAEVLAKKIAYSQRAHGADFGWASNKLMRVPGTVNTKPTYDKPIVTATHSGRIYAYKELKKKFAAINLEPNGSAIDIPMPKEFPPLHEVLAKIPHTLEIQSLYDKPAEPTNWNPKGSRFMVLWKLACVLFRQGLTREEVFVMCQSSRNNKYEQDHRSPTELWRDIVKAEEEVIANKVIFVNDDADQPAVDIMLRPGVVLLSSAERSEVHTDLFIDRYLSWASKNTQADHRYHRANAMIILSTILSEFGYGTPQHGSLNLEMWFMILGVTTRSYKTTAAKFMLRTLRALGVDRDTPYEVASDPTPEALTIALSKRGEVSSIYHSDEAHGMVGDSKGGKSYMVGFLRLLTQLYDGEVPARERVVTGSTKATKTHLTLSLLGVPGKMTETLTRDDFASGFLARFIFVVGTPAPRDPANRWLNQSQPGHSKDRDPEFNNLLLELATLRAKWQRRAHSHEDKKIAIRVDDNAWARWNNLVLDLDKIADEADDPEVVQPTAERTAVSVHKLACLIAMSQSRSNVNMQDMLTAIQYAEKWYDTMTLMASLVHENKWARQVKELVEYVGASRKSYNTVYRRFNGYKPREFMDIVESAEQSGQIDVITETTGRGIVRYLEAAK